MFKNAMEVIEQSLAINSNHFDSLWVKGYFILIIQRKMFTRSELI